MVKPDGAGSSTSTITRFRVLFAVVVVAAIIISSMTIYGLLNHKNTSETTGSYPSEPFPALWQENFTGTPSEIETCANGVLYFLVESNST